MGTRKAVTNQEADASASRERFVEYLNRLAYVVEHHQRKKHLHEYCTALLLESERKSVEPLAERITPDDRSVSATHQSLLHFIGNAAWSDEAVLAAVREYTLPAITQHAPISVWIADDTGIPKQGKHSVGVAHQYCGQLGKQSRCQVAVTLSIANAHASLPIAYRLYLPQEWTNDLPRMQQVGIPDDVVFVTKPQIALQQVRAALDAGIPRGTFLADAGYGNDTSLRDQLTEWGVPYAVSVQESTSVWKPGSEPLPPAAWNGIGRKPKRLRRDAEHQPISVKQLALELV